MKKRGGVVYAVKKGCHESMYGRSIENGRRGRRVAEGG
jgi:hypothetical protein